MPYLEKDFQTSFNKWCKHKFNKTAVFELKLARGNSLPFSAFEDHQIYNLYNAKHAQLIYKIPDTGYQNPFDCISLFNVESYVVIMFTKNLEFFMIDIDDFIAEIKASDRKSITKERAAVIGTSYYLARQ